MKKFFKRERTYVIPKNAIPKHEKLKNFGGVANDLRVWQLYESEESYFFKLNFNDKGAEAFEKMALDLHREDGVPLYTFRCFSCGFLFPLNVFDSMLIVSKPPKWSKNTIQPICKICK